MPEEEGTAIIDATRAIIDQLDVKQKSEAVETSGGDPVIPDESALGQVFPNPFNESTTINYSIHTENDLPVHVWMSVYSMTGQLVANLIDRKMSTGYYTHEWHGETDDGRKVPEGTYIIRFVTDDIHNVKILMKLD